MLCVCLRLLVSSNSLWKLQTNMVQLFIRWWLGGNAMFNSLERINLKIFLKTTSSVFYFSQPTKPHVFSANTWGDELLPANVLFASIRNKSLSAVSEASKRLSEYDQQTFLTEHQISPEVICLNYTLAHLTVFALLIILLSQKWDSFTAPGCSLLCDWVWSRLEPW